MEYSKNKTKTIILLGVLSSVLVIGISFMPLSYSDYHHHPSPVRSLTQEENSHINITPKKFQIEPGDLMVFNGTAIPNKSLEIILEDPMGKQIHSDILDIYNTGLVEFEYKTNSKSIKGTYTLFVTQEKTTEIILFGVGEPPEDNIVAATFDQLNYMRSSSDVAILHISGPASETLSLLITDSFGHEKVVDDKITLNKHGKWSYELDIRDYSTGVYAATLSAGNMNTTRVFTIGVVASGPIEINTAKSVYYPGELVAISGQTYENDSLLLRLIDPDGNVVLEVETFSDKEGNMHDNSLKIPNTPAYGTWKIQAINEPNHDIAEVEVVPSSTKGTAVTRERISSATESTAFAEESFPLLPPLKQFQQGIPIHEIQCNDQKTLIQSPSGKPACINNNDDDNAGTTLEKLEKRGWKVITTTLTEETSSNSQKDQSSESHIMITDNNNTPESQLTSTENNSNNLSRLVDANNQFAFDFYSRISQNSNYEEDENIFFSPVSISAAFSILYEGAREDTEKEIRSVFGFSQDAQERRSNYASLANSINEKSSADDDTKLQIANALWLAQNFEPLPKYVDVATTYYNSTVDAVDFESDNNVNKINDWVKTKTENKIKKVLESGSTGPNTRMVITNAIYFKGAWEHPFDPEDTYEGNFVTGSRETVKVPMMMYPHKMEINHTHTDQLHMLEMPYNGNALSMLIILPHDMDEFKSVESSLTKESLNSLKDKFYDRGLIVHIPKFTLETAYSLEKTLSDMGMPSAFSRTDADLSGIAGNKGLFVSQAAHKAFVDVNEKGTEAAGVTMVGVDESSGQLFQANRPFIFLIQDNETDQILFMGRVMDPTK